MQSHFEPYRIKKQMSFNRILHRRTIFHLNVRSAEFNQEYDVFFSLVGFFLNSLPSQHSLEFSGK